MSEWNYPVDPECPAVARFYRALCDDPMTAAYGAPVDELGAAFEQRQRAKCCRCREYGAANVEVR